MFLLRNELNNFHFRALIWGPVIYDNVLIKLLDTDIRGYNGCQFKMFCSEGNGHFNNLSQYSRIR